MKRRNFILSTAFALPYNRKVLASASQPKFQKNPFPLGVASGDITSSNAVLWTRLALDPLADDGGLADVDVLVDWELSTDQDMKNIIQSGATVAIPELAHSVHIELEGLRPNQHYWYRFSVPNHQSIIGRTKTLAGFSNVGDSARFVTVSCQNYTHGSFVAYEHIVGDKPDFVIHLGDYIYDKSFGQEYRKHEGNEELYTLADFRRRHALYKTDRQLQQAHRELPFFTTIDNHDAVTDNDAAETGRRAAAHQAWYEHMPVRGYPGIGSNQFDLYREIDIPNLLSINFLDTRQFRDKENLCPENNDPDYGFGNYRELCPEFYRAERTMLGKDQEERLKNRIGQNQMAWQAIASSGPIMPFEFQRGNKKMHYVGAWDGYPANRRRLTDALRASKSKNTVFLSGDVHSFWASDGRKLSNAMDRIPAVEFITSSISANWPAPLADPISKNLERNPQTIFYDPKARGYLLHEVTSSRWQTSARAIADVSDANSEAYDLARFELTNGHPGLKRTL